jgi:hypothetical protein
MAAAAAVLLMFAAAVDAGAPKNPMGALQSLSRARDDAAAAAVDVVVAFG